MADRVSGYTLSEIREAMATQIRNNITREATVKPYPDGKVAPGESITITAAPSYVPEYWVTMSSSGFARASFILELDPWKSGADVKSRHTRRDDYLSAGTGNDSSIIDALMSDPTLGLTNCTIQIGEVLADETDVSATIAVDVKIKKVGANA